MTELYRNTDAWNLVMEYRREMTAVEAHRKRMAKVFPELIREMYIINYERHSGYYLSGSPTSMDEIWEQLNAAAYIFMRRDGIIFSYDIESPYWDDIWWYSINA